MKQRESQKGQSLLEAHVTFAFDVVESKPLVCVPWTAQEGSSSPPASHSSGASCGGTSQDPSRCRSERVPGARHGQQMRFVTGFFFFWLRAFLSFVRSTRKLLLNPRGLFSSLLPLWCTVFSHSARAISVNLLMYKGKLKQTYICL